MWPGHQFLACASVWTVLFLCIARPAAASDLTICDTLLLNSFATGVGLITESSVGCGGAGADLNDSIMSQQSGYELSPRAKALGKAVFDGNQVKATLYTYALAGLGLQKNIAPPLFSVYGDSSASIFFAAQFNDRITVVSSTTARGSQITLPVSAFVHFFSMPYNQFNTYYTRQNTASEAIALTISDNNVPVLGLQSSADAGTFCSTPGCSVVRQTVEATSQKVGLIPTKVGDTLSLSYSVQGGLSTEVGFHPLFPSDACCGTLTLENILDASNSAGVFIGSVPGVELESDSGIDYTIAPTYVTNSTIPEPSSGALTFVSLLLIVLQACPKRPMIRRWRERDG